MVLVQKHKIMLFRTQVIVFMGGRRLKKLRMKRLVRRPDPPTTIQSCRNSSGQVGQNMEMDEAGLHRSFVIEQHRVFMPLCCKLGDSFIPYLFILSYLFTIRSRVWISSNYIRNVNAWIIESSRRDHDGLRQPLPGAVLRRIAQVLLQRIADDSTRVAENSR